MHYEARRLTCMCTVQISRVLSKLAVYCPNQSGDCEESMCVGRPFVRSLSAYRLCRWLVYILASGLALQGTVCTMECECVRV